MVKEREKGGGNGQPHAGGKKKSQICFIRTHVRARKNGVIKFGGDFFL
jgi:hypothetical protein